jgi:multidrug efflux pump subunit AcrA (membrane-fusion protein)
MKRAMTTGGVRVAAATAAMLLSGCGLHGKPKIDRSKGLSTHSPHGPAMASSFSPDLAEPDRVVAPGIVESWGGEVELSPQESGWIAKILVSEGQQVQAGQILAELDSDRERAAVDLAQADLAEAEATLAKTVNGSTAEQLQQARSEAEASRERAELAQRDADRSARLGQDSAIPSSEVDRASAEARARSAVASASAARLAELQRGARHEERMATRNRVDAARARLALARASLARREVVAPVAGAILLSRFHVGEFLNVGPSPMFVVGDTSKLQVRLEVDEIDAFRVKDGASCTLYANDNHELAEASIFRIAPQMGRRGLGIETLTARADVRVREVFVQTPASSALVPGQRVWGHIVPSDPSKGPLARVDVPHGN